MTSYEERHAAARELDSRLAKANDLWGKSPVFAENADLLGQLVSRIAIAGNGRDISHIATEVTDTVERAVGKVRTIATDNAVKASRGIVFGVLVLITVLIALPLLVILAVGVLQELIGFGVDHDRAVWISYFGMGGILMILGFLALRSRHAKDPA